MRIKPAVVTGMAGVVALAAVLVVVVSTTPQQASSTLIGCLWVAVFLAVWGLFSTAILLTHQTLARAVFAGLIIALATLAALMLLQHGIL
jgi:hypothetical protein